METVIESSNHETPRQSVKEAWRHLKKIWSAASVSEAWNSFKQMLEALPAWAMVVGAVALFAMITNPAAILALLFSGLFLAAIYLTVKHAVRAALREHDQTTRHST